MKHLEERNTCPTCDIVIHQSHPLNYIAFDRTMQDIVCKLVPMLQEGESCIHQLMRRDLESAIGDFAILALLHILTNTVALLSWSLPKSLRK